MAKLTPRQREMQRRLEEARARLTADRPPVTYFPQPRRLARACGPMVVGVCADAAPEVIERWAA